jgi:hypothetical protein
LDGWEAIMKKCGHFLTFTVPASLSTFVCGAAAQADTWTPFPLAPLYKVEAVRFHCNDETGYDEPWFAPWTSDEVRVGISTPAATTISTVFTDVDSGETRNFTPEQSCIYPIQGQSSSGDNVFTASESWTCSNAGSPGPISFTVVMAEEDSGFFHDCLSDFPGCTFSRTEVPDQNDELIGRHTVEFTPEQLAFALPNVGDFIEPVITLTPPGDGSLHAGGPDPAEYMFTYRITRVAPKPLLSDGGAQITFPTPTQ